MVSSCFLFELKKNETPTKPNRLHQLAIGWKITREIMAEIIKKRRDSDRMRYGFVDLDSPSGCFGLLLFSAQNRLSMLRWLIGYHAL